MPGAPDIRHDSRRHRLGHRRIIDSIAWISERKLEIRRNDKVYYQEYARRVPTTELVQTGTTRSGECHGTKTRRMPSPASIERIAHSGAPVRDSIVWGC